MSHSSAVRRLLSWNLMKPTFRVAISLAAVVCALAPRGLTAQNPSAAELAAAVQRRYASVRDFTADFIHSYQGGVLRQKTVERGRLEVKKPGKMRWTYTAPEKKEFISDGVKIYSYLPADRQVIVADAPRGEETTAAMFLAGRGDLTRDFTVTLEPRSLSFQKLKLTPRQRQQDFEVLFLTVESAGLRISSLEAVDRQGGRSRFDFSNLKENVGLADKRFVFTIPRGVEVVRSGG